MLKTLLFLFGALSLTGCAVFPGLVLSTVGDAGRGADLFSHGRGDAPACSMCHHSSAGQTGFSIGPNLANVSGRAWVRVEGLAAEQYIRQSILDPHAFIVPGYRAMMYPDYAQHLSAQDIQDLIAYLLTL